MNGNGKAPAATPGPPHRPRRRGGIPTAPESTDLDASALFRARRPTRAVLLDEWPWPHPWLAGLGPDRDAFARCVVHADRDPAWIAWAVDQYSDRWGPDELIAGVRHARRLAPLPRWATQLLREHIGTAA